MQLCCRDANAHGWAEKARDACTLHLIPPPRGEVGARFARRVGGRVLQYAPPLRTLSCLPPPRRRTFDALPLRYLSAKCVVGPPRKGEVWSLSGRYDQTCVLLTATRMRPEHEGDGAPKSANLWHRLRRRKRQAPLGAPHALSLGRYRASRYLSADRGRPQIERMLICDVRPAPGPAFRLEADKTPGRQPAPGRDS